MNNDVNKIYLGEFSSRENTERLFEIELPESVNILLATYNYGDYCGSAFVIFEQDGKYFEINASHCSCYGLEGQWKPDEISFNELRHRAKEGNLYSYGESDFKEALDIILEKDYK